MNLKNKSNLASSIRKYWFYHIYSSCNYHGNCTPKYSICDCDDYFV